MQEYPVHTLQQLGLVLRNARKAQGDTQGIAGAKVGLLTKTVSALETRPGSSTVASLFKLLSALDLDLVLKPKGSDAASRPGRTKPSQAASQAEW